MFGHLRFLISLVTSWWRCGLKSQVAKLIDHKYSVTSWWRCGLKLWWKTKPSLENGVTSWWRCGLKCFLLSIERADMSHLLMEVWIEIAKGIKWVNTFKVTSWWRCGLKYRHNNGIGGIAGHLLMEVWIEMVCVWVCTITCGSHLLMEVWIEISNGSASHRNLIVTSWWRCGLKLIF